MRKIEAWAAIMLDCIYIYDNKGCAEECAEGYGDKVERLTNADELIGVVDVLKKFVENSENQVCPVCGYDACHSDCCELKAVFDAATRIESKTTC